jgi:hypothetical protein
MIKSDARWVQHDLPEFQASFKKMENNSIGTHIRHEYAPIFLAAPTSSAAHAISSHVESKSKVIDSR